MTNAQCSDNRDQRVVAVRQDSTRLVGAAEGGPQIKCDPTDCSRPDDRKLLAQCLKNRTLPEGCTQRLWFSFFFDGTGNNLEADLRSFEHTNVARLYRAHAGDAYYGEKLTKADYSEAGIFRIYIPGVGTYFREVGDNGGSERGLGIGEDGQARLDWAFKQFDLLMKGPLARTTNPTNAIVELNIAAFGFSRGAAAARAFIHDFVKDRCIIAGKALRLKTGNCPVRIRFLGLFDTVASVGPGVSFNNINTLEAKAPLEVKIATRHRDYPMSSARNLAFAPAGRPGADPAPGKYDGHSAWGSRLRIPDEVENVRHFIAAHEFRNSFPVDSIHTIDPVTGRQAVRPHFHEYVRAGVHSDVGGGYRPGEGGKNVEPGTKIGLVHLRKMYEFAVGAEVPLRSPQAWDTDSQEDFRCDTEVFDDYAYYLTRLRPTRQMLGDIVLANMKLYYQWRFHVINRKRTNDQSERRLVKESASRFAKEEAELNREIRNLEFKVAEAESKHVALEAQRGNASRSFGLRTAFVEEQKSLEKAILVAKNEKVLRTDELRRAQARLLTLPKEQGLSGLIDYYDSQLLLDAQSILDLAMESKPMLRSEWIRNRQTLRPHYKILVEAYENEFIKGQGLRDKKIIDFFEKYVHNSLAAFAKDATLPSDPRVLFAGDDYRIRYANRIENRAVDSQIA